MISWDRRAPRSFLTELAVTAEVFGDGWVLPGGPVVVMIGLALISG